MRDDPKRDIRAEVVAIVAARFGHGASWPPPWVFGRLRGWQVATDPVARAARAPAPYRSWAHIAAFLRVHDHLKGGGDGDLG